MFWKIEFKNAFQLAQIIPVSKHAIFSSFPEVIYRTLRKDSLVIRIRIVPK